MAGKDRSPEEQARRLFLISIVSIAIFSGLAYVLVQRGGL